MLVPGYSNMSALLQSSARKKEKQLDVLHGVWCGGHPVKSMGGECVAVRGGKAWWGWAGGEVEKGGGRAVDWYGGGRVTGVKKSLQSTSRQTAKK